MDAGGETLAIVVDECRLFGLHTIKDLQSIFTSEFLAAVDWHTHNENQVGLTRDAMMYEDLDKYFDKCWRNSWNGIDSPCVKLLSSRYTEKVVWNKLEPLGIELIEEGGFNDFDVEDE